MEYAQMQQLVLLKSNKINNVISKLLYKSEMLAALIIQENGVLKDFKKVASSIVDDPAIKNIILAPEGVVRYVYPLENNHAVLGLDYFSEGEGNREAITARNTGELVLGGPFNLIQGGQALVGRYPVFMEENGAKKFWGIVSVTLNYPQALADAELEQLQQQNLAYEIWRISPETQEKQIIASSNYAYNKSSRYVEYPLNILNANWFFRLSPVRVWYEYPETWIFIAFGLLISGLITSLAVHNYNLRQIQSELENLSYRDPLTEVLNRRGLFRILEELVTDPFTPFLLCYIDLDKFKKINDTLGHRIGNAVLWHFSRCITESLTDSHIFARIGGDEFALVIKGSADRADADSFFAKTDCLIKNINLDESLIKSPVKYSYGVAVFPSDSVRIDELMSLSDNAMYKSKLKKMSDKFQRLD